MYRRGNLQGLLILIAHKSEAEPISGRAQWWLPSHSAPPMHHRIASLPYRCWQRILNPTRNRRRHSRCLSRSSRWNSTKNIVKKNQRMSWARMHRPADLLTRMGFDHRMRHNCLLSSRALRPRPCPRSQHPQPPGWRLHEAGAPWALAVGHRAGTASAQRRACGRFAWAPSKRCPAPWRPGAGARQRAAASRPHRPWQEGVPCVARSPSWRGALWLCMFPVVLVLQTIIFERSPKSRPSSFFFGVLNIWQFSNTSLFLTVWNYW